MKYDISFDDLVRYDPGLPGISVYVELRSGNSAINVEAKIDTGAENCIFSRDCAERLGLDIETGEQQRFSTVTGGFLAYAHRLTLVTSGYELDSPIFFAADDSFDRNVLGRFGWLDRIIIGINDYDGELYLKNYE